MKRNVMAENEGSIRRKKEKESYEDGVRRLGKGKSNGVWRDDEYCEGVKKTVEGKMRKKWKKEEKE